MVLSRETWCSGLESLRSGWETVGEILGVLLRILDRFLLVLVVLRVVLWFGLLGIPAGLVAIGGSRTLRSQRFPRGVFFSGGLGDAYDYGWNRAHIFDQDLGWFEWNPGFM